MAGRGAEQVARRGEAVIPDRLSRLQMDRPNQAVAIQEAIDHREPRDHRLGASGRGAERAGILDGQIAHVKVLPNLGRVEVKGDLRLALDRLNSARKLKGETV